jgi:propanol-preferring alcohol dehydrogenase
LLRVPVAGATIGLVLAWQVSRPGPLSSNPLDLVEVPLPSPVHKQVRIRVSVCGICRTDLHVTVGDLPVHKSKVVPGHEVVGVVESVGSDCTRFRPGDRIGIAWLGGTCGTCRFCRRGDENLCERAVFTGWDLDGGYAEATLVDERFAYSIPATVKDDQAAPLLCAGIIGYRALCRCDLPPGGRLGIYGFGGSAHLTAQIAMKQGAEVHVVTRSAGARRLAEELGVASVAAASGSPPAPLDAAIIFAPAGELVPSALEALDKGGVLVVAGIHLSDVPPLDYERQLFYEKELRSVTANTRRDGEEFLKLASRLGVVATTSSYDFQDADKALVDLAEDRVNGAAVLHMGRG